MRYLLALAAFFMILTPVFADTIYLKSGLIINGKVLRVTESEVEYSTPEIPFDKESRSKLIKIVYTNGKTVMFNESAAVQPQTDEQPVVRKTEKKKQEVEEENDEGVETHDGFYFGFLYGFGYGNSKLSGTNTLEMKGLGGIMSLELGYAVMDNLILYGTINVIIYTPTRYTYNGQTYSLKDHKQNANEGGLGFGFRSYFMPENFYVSASFTPSSMIYSGDFVKGDSKFGLSILGALGKEWWLSDNWGLGAALYVQYSRQKFVDNNNRSGSINSYSLGIAFSATYN
jgi:hypothetical protein